METVKITLSANAGFALEAGQNRIWVDALHEEKQPGFSAVPDSLQRQMLKCPAFFSPDAICYTHCHPDHYSRRLTETAIKIWPRAKLVLPEPEFADQILLTGREFEMAGDSLAFRFIRLTHEGPQYANVNHYGLILTYRGKRILIAGDCATASPELAAAVAGLPIDLAILNFPWITLAKGRDFIQSVLEPRHILLCHLPFSADDEAGYRQSAQRWVTALQQDRDIRLLWDPLQEETVLL